MYIFDWKLKRYPWKYIAQSLLALATIIIILVFLDEGIQTALIASLGATAFTVFIQPHHCMSGPRSVLGGYAVGISAGILLGSLIAEKIALIIPISYSLIIAGGLAVGFAIFLMAATNTEHPPAAGIALGLTLNEWNFKTIIFIVSAVTVMSLIRKIFKSVMKNLIGGEELFKKSCLKLISQVFTDSGKMPDRYSRDGENISPLLVIENILPSARSLVLKAESYRNIFKTTYHWVVWDIPPNIGEIKEGVSPGVKGKNSFDFSGYTGPRRCRKEHNYHFKIYALDKKLNLPEGTGVISLEKAMEGHIVQAVRLTGRY